MRDLQAPESREQPFPDWGKKLGRVRTEVHCGTVLGGEIDYTLDICLPNGPIMHYTANSTQILFDLGMADKN